MGEARDVISNAIPTLIYLNFLLYFKDKKKEKITHLMDLQGMVLIWTLKVLKSFGTVFDSLNILRSFKTGNHCF